MLKNKAWVQAAIDVEDIDLAKRIAFIALDNGAEWLEVGTPLLYKYGHAAIKAIRDAVGVDPILIADYKCMFAMLCAQQAKKAGADYILLSAGYNETYVANSVEFANNYEIEPVFELCVRNDDMGKYIQKYTGFGAKYFYDHHYSYVDGVKKDSISAMRSSGKEFFLGVTSDDFEEAEDAVRNGADWITFGVALKSADKELCRKWIDMIHNARG